MKLRIRIEMQDISPEQAQTKKGAIQTAIDNMEDITGTCDYRVLGKTDLAFLWADLKSVEVTIDESFVIMVAVKNKVDNVSSLNIVKYDWTY